MFRSQNFLAQEQNLHKSHSVDSDEYFNAVRDVLRRHLPRFNEEFVAEVFDFAVGRADDTGSSIQFMADTIDLLWMQYDDHNDPYTTDDWIFIRDLINDNALDLDMDLVQYVMERVVAHHAI